MTSILNTPLQTCSTDPVTGYYRDGFCKNRPDDSGTHVVCAKVTKEFLNFTKSKGNNLTTPSKDKSFSGLKDGDRWCLCALRWEEARKANKAPPVVLESTDKTALNFNRLQTYINNSTKKNQKGSSRKTRKFNVYIDANPKNTIHIKYTTVEDVKNTILKLEKLYKNRTYPHKRIWQVAMIMKVRLEVLKNSKPQQYKLASNYLKFLGKRTRMNRTTREESTFKI